MSDTVDGDDVDPSTTVGVGTPELHASLRDLAGLTMEAYDLDALLRRVATFAARSIPRAHGAGVTLVRVQGAQHRVEALAASHPFVAEIDDIQYHALGEGPCVTAATERRTVRSGSLAADTRWPRFGPAVGPLGVSSALSLPLLLPDEVVGAINVYSREQDAFDDRAARIGEEYAGPATVAVHNARLLARSRVLVEQLQTAMVNRPVIDQAIGLIRGRSGVSADEALARLRATSQQENVKLAEVARRLVDEAVRRARARREPD